MGPPTFLGGGVRFSAVLGLICTAVFLLSGAASSSADSGNDVPVARIPLEVVVDAQGTAYVGHYACCGGVSVLPAGASAPSRVIAVGYQVSGLAVAPDGTVYAEGWNAVANHEQIGVVLKGASEVARAIPLPAGAHLIAAGPDGTVFVPNYAPGTVSVIPAGASAPVREVAVGKGPREIAVGKDGTAYVTNQEGGTVSVISPGASASRTIRVSANPDRTDSPHGIAVGPDGSVFVTDITANEIAVIKPAGTTVAYRIPVANSPKEVAVGPDGTVYALSESQGLAVIRPDEKTATLLPTDHNPGHVAAEPDGSAIVTNTEDSSVTVFPTALTHPGAESAAAPAVGAPVPSAGPASDSSSGAPDGNASAALLPGVFGGAAAAMLLGAALVIATGRRRRRRSTAGFPDPLPEHPQGSAAAQPALMPEGPRPRPGDGRG